MQHGSEFILIVILHDGEAFIESILHIDETSSQAADRGLHSSHVISRSGQFPA
jgi:hypothetical protein